MIDFSVFDLKRENIDGYILNRSENSFNLSICVSCLSVVSERARAKSRVIVHGSLER